jgi:hypothetical protein
MTIPHIRHTHEDRKHTSWCGRSLTQFDWTFQNIDHAVYSHQQGSIPPCRKCFQAIVKAMGK